MLIISKLNNNTEATEATAIDNLLESARNVNELDAELINAIRDFDESKKFKDRNGKTFNPFRELNSLVIKILNTLRVGMTRVVETNSNSNNKNGKNRSKSINIDPCCQFRTVKLGRF